MGAIRQRIFSGQRAGRLKAREKVGDCISPVSFAIRKITVPASFTIDLELPARFFLDHERKSTSRVNAQCCTFYPHLPPREVQSKVLVPQLLVSSAEGKLVSVIKVL
jgi:hypothetical protein